MLTLGTWDARSPMGTSSSKGSTLGCNSLLSLSTIFFETHVAQVSLKSHCIAQAVRLLLPLST